MTALREAAQQALEALQNCANGEDDVLLTRDALAALRAALAEPVQDGFDQLIAEMEADPKGAQALEDGRRWVKEQFYAGAEPVQEPVALDWLHKWANQDDGEPETQWHEGYEAARRVVQIHLTAPPQRPAEPVQEPDVPETNFGNMEPVAWQERQAKRMRDGIVTEWTDWYPCQYRTADKARAGVCDQIPYEWRPLYTSPPQRKPLSEEEIAVMRTSIPKTVPFLEALVLYTRAVERKHGIGGKDE